MKRLELMEVGVHGLEELLFLGTAATGARFIDNLEPGGGEHLFIEHLPLSGCPGARRPREVDEQVITHPQVPA